MLHAVSAHILHALASNTEPSTLELENGIITGVRTGASPDTVQTVAPGYLDVHVHGAMSFDFMSSTPAETDTIGAFLATKGIAGYLATTVTGQVDATLRSLDRLASYIQRGSRKKTAEMLGIHLEGPFLCPAKRGVHPAALLLPPDLKLLERFQEAAQGQVKLITLAPEMPGALELIGYATAKGIRVSLGHSNATAAEARKGMEAGATSATHTFNAMRAMDHREPGIAGFVLDSEGLFAELIADGVHVHPSMVRLWLKAKGASRAILVTDGMAATGMPDGTYRLGDLVVEVHDGVCMSDGVLAGSVLTMDRAVSNVCEMTGAPLALAVRLASINPAAMLGLEAALDVRVGAPATFNLFDEQGIRMGMWLRGYWIPA